MPASLDDVRNIFGGRLCDPGEIAPFKADRVVILEDGDLSYISAWYSVLRHRRLAWSYYRMGWLDGRKLEWGAKNDFTVRQRHKRGRGKFRSVCGCVSGAGSVGLQGTLIL